MSQLNLINQLLQSPDNRVEILDAHTSIIAEQLISCKLFYHPVSSNSQLVSLNLDFSSPTRHFNLLIDVRAAGGASSSHLLFDSEMSDAPDFSQDQKIIIIQVMQCFPNSIPPFPCLCRPQLFVH